jgi:hypothetical protein
VGDWAACPVCHGLIQKDDQAGLADRALNFLLGKYHGIAKSEADELYQWECWKPAFAEAYQRRRHDRRPCGVVYLWWNRHDSPKLKLERTGRTQP